MKTRRERMDEALAVLKAQTVRLELTQSDVDVLVRVGRFILEKTETGIVTLLTDDEVRELEAALGKIDEAVNL